jgi:hypothetical protein
VPHVRDFLRWRKQHYNFDSAPPPPSAPTASYLATNMDAMWDQLQQEQVANLVPADVQQYLGDELSILAAKITTLHAQETVGLEEYSI